MPDRTKLTSRPFAVLVLFIAFALAILWGYWALNDETDISVLDTESTSENQEDISAADSGLKEAYEAEVPSRDVKSQLAISFPDGEKLDVTLRRYSPQRLDVVRLVDDYDALRTAAEDGDADSALALSRVLETCGSTYRTKDELEAAINNLHQSHTVTVAGSDEQAKIAGTDNMSLVEEQLRATFELCEGASQARIDESDYWLEVAAELGSSEAAISIGQRALGTKDFSAERYLESAWRSGDIQAASHLWYLYGGGIPEKTDMVTAYAYKYLHDQFIFESVAAGATVLGPPVTVQSMNAAANRLSPHELKQAHLLAKEILRENEKCCFSHRLRF